MLSFLRAYYPTVFNDALAKWLGVSERSLQRKARELGLSKVENFNRVRSEDISLRISESLKKTYANNGHRRVFKPGVRNNPEGEFKPGHRYDEETEERRKDKIRRTFSRRKLLKRYGL